MTGADNRYLPIYLDDHLSGATVALHRVRRSARAYAGTPAGEVLAPFAVELEEERAFLAATAERLGVHVSRYKIAGAWVAERLGRHKPNGHLMTTSPLGALLEVELLLGAVTAKRSGWETLALLDDQGVEGIDRGALDRVQAQADGQVERLTGLLDRLRPVVGRG